MFPQLLGNKESNASQDEDRTFRERDRSDPRPSFKWFRATHTDNQGNEPKYQAAEEQTKMSMNTEQLTWEYSDRFDDGPRWDAETVKWDYEIDVEVDEQGRPSFVALRYSSNEAMCDDHTGTLGIKCSTLKEAKAIAEDWHRERYGEHQSEFIEYGGNTSAAAEAETKEWSGKFKCYDCGEPITDSNTIRGILHCSDAQRCESCWGSIGYEEYHQVARAREAASQINSGD